jgi:iron-sulfur cluster repair protein YtfE (RIC family)
VNVLNVLHADHAVVSNLFEETRQPGNADQLVELFEKIRKELEVHIRAEEGIFYPEVERIGPQAADVIATALEQHGEAVVLLGLLARMQPSAGEYRTKLKELEDGVKKHVQFEEDRIFKLVRENLGNQLDDLGERVKHREEALKAGGQIAGSE